MQIIARLFFVCAVLSALPAPRAHAAPMQSNGLDGAFAPDASLLLTPDDDGIFHFTTIDIAEPVLVSFDRSSWEGAIYLLATGDINIYGALDTGPGPLHLYTPGVITLAGKVYGDTITLAGEEIHYINNPNGNPDMHLVGGVYTTIQPDGGLVLSVLDPVVEIDAGNLAGVWDMMDARDLTGVVTTAYIYPPPGEIMPMATPLPPAVWLLLSAVVVLGGLGRGGRLRVD